MSRQNKAAKKSTLAKAFTALRKNGESGPKQTTPKHGKKVTYRQTLAASIKAKQRGKREAQ
jgi:hypothetical protein